MRKTTSYSSTFSDALSVDTAGLQKMLNSGRQTATQIGMAAGARNVDGDIFDLMIHVRGYTLKEAIAELKSAFNIKDSPIGKNTVKEAWIAYLERKFNVKVKL